MGVIFLIIGTLLAILAFWRGLRGDIFPEAETLWPTCGLVLLILFISIVLALISN